MSAARPLLSVIIPAHHAARMLAETLPALVASDLPRDCWELILVDDASTDETALVAAPHADTVVRLAGKPHGPAYARNRGAEVSRGDVLVFFDADVRVHNDTLHRFANLFTTQRTLGAAFGSYDARPAAPGIVSQYRNLLHHYVHQQGAGEAETFWAGCGAIRRSAFLEIGMFDEWHYPRPQIEDIELGRRLRRQGYRILLRPDIEVTHLKRWTLSTVLATDFRQRGVPWMWLVLQEGTSPGSHALNLRTVEKLCTALVAIGIVALVTAVLSQTVWPLVSAGGALGVMLLLNVGFYRCLHRHRGFGLVLAGIPLHLLYHLSNAISAMSGWLIQILFGEPQPSAETAALAQIGLKTWPPAPSRPRTSIWNLPRSRPSGRPGT